MSITGYEYEDAERMSREEREGGRAWCVARSRTSFAGATVADLRHVVGGSESARSAVVKSTMAGNGLAQSKTPSRCRARNGAGRERETRGNMRTREPRISGTARKSVQAISAYFRLFHAISTIFYFFLRRIEGAAAYDPHFKPGKFYIDRISDENGCAAGLSPRINFQHFAV
jgi:hypothetical protein